jgi:hypothetical protein
MKTRQGFVSNSSASSFTCDVCGDTMTGFDGEYEEQTYTCINNHTLCEEDLLEDIDGAAEEGVDSYELPEKFCPICQWQTPCERNIARLLLTKYKVPQAEAFEEIKKVNRRRKRLYDPEYVSYVCQKFNLNITDIIGAAKKTFPNYHSFLEALDNEDQK